MKIFGQWGKKTKKASGASDHVCETRRGFVDSSARKHLRVFCGECQALRAIADCLCIEEKESSSTYDVILATCGHRRAITVAVEFKPSKEKRGTQEKERASLLSEMDDARLL